MTRSPMLVTFVLFLALAARPSMLRADNWPSWRGPNSQGASSEKDLPVTWSDTENICWKTLLPGPGNSTPIIWGDKIFITQASETSAWPPKVPENFTGGSSAGGHAVSEKRSVMCFRRTDGKLLWQGDTTHKEPEITHPTNPFCSASPVTDGERVIAHHGSAGLVCYDLDGKRLWHVDTGKLEHLWGTASSPIIHGDLCIQWCGPGDRQFLIAVNKVTGEKVWEVQETGGDTGITSGKFTGTWATPIIARVGKKDQLIFAVPRALKGFDPLTGKLLWTVDRAAGNYGYTSPLVVDNLAVYGRNVIALGDGEKPELLRYRVGGMYISTAAVQGGFLYCYSGAGVGECFKLQTGDNLWKPQVKKRPGGKTAWGSPVYADGRIYITDQNGDTSVFAAGEKYEHLALNKLGERTNASIAISSGNLFIRTHKHLWCIGVNKQLETE